MHYQNLILYFSVNIILNFADKNPTYEIDNFDLPSADEANFTYPENTIFFIETDCRGINLREACSVESAARAHPKRPVYIFFTNPIPSEYLKTKPLIALSKYSNIKLFRIDIAKFSKNTPFESVLNSENLKLSQHVIHHTSDVLRYLFLYKFGGTYSDLDVIMVKSLDTLPQTENWTCKEEEDAMAAGIMSFSKDNVGRRVINATVRILRNNFDPKQFSYNSIGVLHDAFQEVCSTQNIMEMCAEKCQGFEVYRHEYFYLFPPRIADVYFLPSGILTKIKFPLSVYGFHVWNYISEKTPLHENSLYARLMKIYCPVVDKLNKDIKKFTVVKRTKLDVGTI